GQWHLEARVAAVVLVAQKRRRHSLGVGWRIVGLRGEPMRLRDRIEVQSATQQLTMPRSLALVGRFKAANEPRFALGLRHREYGSERPRRPFDDLLESAPSFVSATVSISSDDDDLGSRTQLLESKQDTTIHTCFRSQRLAMNPAIESYRTSSGAPKLQILGQPKVIVAARAQPAPHVLERLVIQPIYLLDGCPARQRGHQHAMSFVLTREADDDMPAGSTDCGHGRLPCRAPASPTQSSPTDCQNSPVCSLPCQRGHSSCWSSRAAVACPPTNDMTWTSSGRK